MQLKVGELARRTGLTVRTLHHFDQIGLLKPSGRSESGYRLYGRDDVARLHGIQALRHLGLPLKQIAGMLAGDGEPLPVIVARQVRALDHQIAQATALRGRLALLIEKFAAGSQPETGDWLDSLALMSNYARPLFEPSGDAELPADVKAFLAAGAAPVVVTLGTFQRHGGPLLKQVVEAARALGRRTVVLAAAREQLPLPPAADLLWQPYLPLHRLLPRSAALVHHGGIGTTAEALRAAVPQLVLPWAFDQFDNAQRVRTLGVGLTLSSRRRSPDSLRRALDQLLNSTAVA